MTREELEEAEVYWERKNNEEKGMIKGWWSDIQYVHPNTHINDKGSLGKLMSDADAMLFELLKICRTVYMTQDESYWKPIKEVIERVTGRPIDEVMKNG